MIIIFLGGIGEGKSLSIIKEIVDNDQMVFVNFKLKNIKKQHRIKITDIINKPYTEEQQIGDKIHKIKRAATVNWMFWENVRKGHKSFSICLDEIHNIIHARRSMSNTNILMSKWVSQIRKILADHPTNHLYIISQTISKIDKDFRDLAQVIVTCRKKQIGKKIYIKQKFYDGIYNYEIRRSRASKLFFGNKYFKYYDSTELVTFTDAEEFI